MLLLLLLWPLVFSLFLPRFIMPSIHYGRSWCKTHITTTFCFPLRSLGEKQKHKRRFFLRSSTRVSFYSLSFLFHIRTIHSPFALCLALHSEMCENRMVGHCFLHPIRVAPIQEKLERLANNRSNNFYLLVQLCRAMSGTLFGLCRPADEDLSLRYK